MITIPVVAASGAQTTVTVPDPVVTSTPATLNLPRIPWEGSNYWSRFPKAAAAGWDDPGFFPIMVWLSNGARAAEYKALGINTYQGLEHNPTLPQVEAAGMFAIPQVDEWTVAEVGDSPAVVGWLASDECDMGLGACTPPVWDNTAEEFEYQTQLGIVNEIRSRNDGRFVNANFGKGIFRTWWSANRIDDHIALMDASGVDAYAYTSPSVRHDFTLSDHWTGAKTDAAVKRASSYGWLSDQMGALMGGRQTPRYAFVETARPYLWEEGAGDITPDQLEGAVWSSLIHESRMISYFNHNNGIGGGTLVDGQPCTQRVQEVNAKVRSLAPVLNTQSYVWDFSAVGIDTMLKTKSGSAYIFAGVGIGGATGTKTFTLPAGVGGATVEVVGEDRSLPVNDNRFTDTFAAEYTHHVYRVAL